MFNVDILSMTFVLKPNVTNQWRGFLRPLN